LRVVIAEDDAVSRRILETLLRKWGYEVTTTLDGEAAWEVLRGPNAPSLAILDIMMPGIDGLELCRRLRNSPTSVPPYIILLTAKQGVREIVEGIEAGAGWCADHRTPDQIG
jgi:DNA-binding response OmpR family regulator